MMLTLDDIINIDWETIRIFGLHSPIVERYCIMTKIANEEYITKSEAIEAACNAVELFPSEYHEIENVINRIADDVGRR